MLDSYVIVESVEDAVKNLASLSGKGRIIAGGSDLILDLKSEKVKCDHLVDINKIQELKTIHVSEEEIIIGACATHNEVSKSEIIKSKASLLSRACSSVGSLQIRNTATLVGNVVKAQPAADGAVALVALGASACIVDEVEKKEILVEDMYAGLGKSCVDSTKELVTSVKFKYLKENEGSSFVRLSQRNALALPMLNVAIVISLDNNKINWARIVMSPVSPKPTRANEAEEYLKGKDISEEILIEASKIAAKNANPRSSALRGSAEYRKDVLKNLVKQGLEEAINEAKI